MYSILVIVLHNTRRRLSPHSLLLQLVDSNYGWDSRESLLEVHFPGLYFLSFSLTADAAASDSFK